MSTTFTMHSGLRTIGGVIFSVTCGSDRIVMEMGSAYNPATDFYDGIVEHRSQSWIRDAIRTGRAPAIDGLYSQRHLQGFGGLGPAESSDVRTAVFITHLHLDHMGAMGFVDPSIPMYLHPAAERIERALEEIGEGVETEPREYIGFEHGVPVRVGDIEVLPLITSTRSYHEFAFLISTPDGTLYWTGDLSLHSVEADLTFAHIEVLRNRDLDVLICDTTSFMDDVLVQSNGSTDPLAIVPTRDVPAGMLSGQDVRAGLYEIVTSRTGLIVFNMYQREIDEATRYIEWAKQVERRCLFEPDSAYLLWKCTGAWPEVFVPDVERYGDDPSRHPHWFGDVLANATLVSREEIVASPGGFMVQNSYRHAMELFDLSTAGGTYLHVDGLPIGAFDPAYQNLRRLVDAAGFEYVTFFNKQYFGHGYPGQVKYFCDEVDAKVLIPCHGFNPERLLPNSGVQLLPELGRDYRLADGQLTAIG